MKTETMNDLLHMQLFSVKILTWIIFCEYFEGDLDD